jgi:hypothetical protein
VHVFENTWADSSRFLRNSTQFDVPINFQEGALARFEGLPGRILRHSCIRCSSGFTSALFWAV